MDSFVIRPSSLGSWADCEKAALFKATKGPLPSRNRVIGGDIRSWFGSAVHAAVAKQDIPPITISYAYNKDLPNERAAINKVKDAAEQIHQFLEKEAINVFEHEFHVKHATLPMEGTIDMLAEQFDENLIIDLKTGSYGLNSTWYQLCAYASMVETTTLKQKGTEWRPTQLAKLLARPLETPPTYKLVKVDRHYYQDHTDSLLINIQTIRNGTRSAIPNPNSMLCPKCPNHTCPWHSSQQKTGET